WQPSTLSSAVSANKPTPRNTRGMLSVIPGASVRRGGACFEQSDPNPGDRADEHPHQPDHKDDWIGDHAKQNDCEADRQCEWSDATAGHVDALQVGCILR